MAERGARGRRRSGRASAASVGALRFAPLIDVVFLLLMYFLLAAEFREPERVFRVDLPSLEGTMEPADPFALPERPINVLIRTTGDERDDYSVETDSPLLPRVTSAGELISALRDAYERDLGAEQRFLLRAETDTHWEHALGALNSVLRAGYANVRFAEPAP